MTIDISGAVADVLRRLKKKYPEVMREFLTEIGIRYDRSGMPGNKSLNGPQVDKVWKKLDLLHTLLREKGAGVYGDGSVAYLQKLQALYFMCVRYLFLMIVDSPQVSLFAVNHFLEIMLGQSRIFGTPSTTCMLWGFFPKPQRYISSTPT